MKIKKFRLYKNFIQQFGIKIILYQKKNWYNKKNFPIDWTARHPLNLDEKNNFKYFKNYNEFINLNLNYVSNFSLVLNENSNIVFKIIGSDKQNSKFKYRKINSDNDIYFNIDKY